MVKMREDGQIVLKTLLTKWLNDIWIPIQICNTNLEEAQLLLEPWQENNTLIMVTNRPIDLLRFLIGTSFGTVVVQINGMK